MDTCGFFARSPEVFSAVAACLFDDERADFDGVRLACHDGLFSRLPLRSQQALLPVRQRLARFFGPLAPLDAPLPDADDIYLAFRQIQGYEAWQAQGETH